MEKISGSLIVLPDGIARDSSISIADGKIEAIDPGKGGVSFDNSIIAPGFIDLHTHGRLGQDTADIDDELLLKYARTGTTALLPTYGCGGLDRFKSWLERVKEMMSDASDGGAEILGAHAEGPFIDPVNSGGINPDSCIVASEDALEMFISSPVLKYMTISPYVDGAINAIEKLTQAGIICVSGHSRGGVESFEQACGAGLRGICHFFNNNSDCTALMKEPGVRKPTICEAALLKDDIFLEIICDLQHVDPFFIKLALRLKGTQRIAVVTDSISAAGLPEGVYDYHDGRRFEIKDGGVHECGSGIRFGSCVTQVEEFANLVERLGLSYQDAALMCALTPAEILGVNSRKGSLEIGKDADMVVLDRDSFELRAVYVKGKQVEM